MPAKPAPKQYLKEPHTLDPSINYTENLWEGLTKIQNRARQIKMFISFYNKE